MTDTSIVLEKNLKSIHKNGDSIVDNVLHGKTLNYCTLAKKEIFSKPLLRTVLQEIASKVCYDLI